MSLYSLFNKPRQVYFRFSLVNDLKSALKSPSQKAVIPYRTKMINKRSNTSNPLENEVFKAYINRSKELSDITKKAIKEINFQIENNKTIQPNQYSMIMTIMNTIKQDKTLLESIRNELLLEIIQISSIPKEKFISSFFKNLIDSDIENHQIVDIIDEMKKTNEIEIPSFVYKYFLLSRSSKETDYHPILNKFISEIDKLQEPISVNILNAILPNWLKTTIKQKTNDQTLDETIDSCFSFIYSFKHVEPNEETFEILCSYCTNISQLDVIRSEMKKKNVVANLQIRKAIAKTYFRLGEGLKIIFAMQTFAFNYKDVVQSSKNFEQLLFSKPNPIVPEISPLIEGTVVPELCSAVLQYANIYNYGPLISSQIQKLMSELLFAPSVNACIHLLGSYNSNSNSILDYFNDKPQYSRFSESQIAHIAELYDFKSFKSYFSSNWEYICTIYPKPNYKIFLKYLNILKAFGSTIELWETVDKMESSYAKKSTFRVIISILNELNIDKPEALKYFALYIKNSNTCNLSDSEIIELFFDSDETQLIQIERYLDSFANSYEKLELFDNIKSILEKNKNIQ